MKGTHKYSIDGATVTEGEFLKKKTHQINVAALDHVIEPFLREINRQRGCIEYKNDTGVSSIKVHNISNDLSSKIQKEIDQNFTEW